jgi:predicted DNA-binding protein (UPF0251 family)
VTPVRCEVLIREAARSETVTVLRLAAAIAGYAAGQVGNGLSPEHARRAVLDAAAELDAAAAALRRLTRLDPARLGPAERRALAVRLAASGMSQQRAAEQVGVARRTLRGYLRTGR